jgi:acetyl esterase/lipase
MPDVSIELDTLYCADPELRCDLYVPAGDAPGVAVLLHGGGWRVGSRAAMADTGEALAARGWCAVAAQYRLLDEAPWPAQIEDVKRVIRWVRASRDRFGAASDNVAVIGYSAGGHLALLAAGTGDTDTFAVPGASDGERERPDAVVSFFAPTRVHGVDAQWLDVDEQGARTASPIEHVSADFPPTLILNGTSDSMIPHATSTELFEALHAAGIPAELRLYAGMTHEFQRLPEMHEHVMDDLVNFLDRYLRLGAPFEEALAERRAFWSARAADRPAPERA